MKKSLLEAEKLIRDLDEKTIDNRAKRLVELEAITLSAIEFELPIRMYNYIDEASKTYIERCYRSCIFCCSNAVEQAFKKELIFSENNINQRKSVQEEIEKMTFGKIINKGKKIDFLSCFINDAEWLKNLRNKVAVHPIYISHGNIGTETPEIAEWRKQSIKKDIETLLPFLDKENQKQMYDVLENQKAIEDIFEWGLSEDIIQILALKAWKKMKRVLEGIYYLH
jgi:hypothetical protein